VRIGKTDMVKSGSHAPDIVAGHLVAVDDVIGVEHQLDVRAADRAL